MFNYQPFETKAIKQHNQDGYRCYVVEGDEVRYPSITQVLKCRGKVGLNQWRQRVGDNEANRVQRRAAGGGHAYHTMVEKYLTNQSFDQIIADVKPYDHTRKRFKEALPMIERIGVIHAIELPLISHALGLGGTVDCVGTFDGISSIIDHKTSRKPKKLEWLNKYFAQTTFYAVAMYELYGFVAQQMVVTMSVEDEQDQVFIQKPQNYINFLRETIDMYHRGEYD